MTEKPLVTVSELRLEDMPGFLAWGHHQDPRFFHYDFPDMPVDQLAFWYRAKRSPLFRWLYAVKDGEGALLGYITVKEINRFTRTAELGIVFDPARLGQGYGTAAMVAFLRIYFQKRHMREIRLRVADFNGRARRSYEKAGFEVFETGIEAFEEQGRNFELMLRHPDCFMMKGPVLMARFHRMRLTRRRFEALYGK